MQVPLQLSQEPRFVGDCLLFGYVEPIVCLLPDIAIDKKGGCVW